MRILLFANTDWFLWNFKLSLARALREAGHEVLLLSPDGPYGEKLKAEGFRWEAFALSRSGVNPFAEFATVRRLARVYRRLKPDLVHHFTIKCVIYGSFAARSAGVARAVNSITGLGFAMLATTPKARLIRPIVVALYRRALSGTEVIFQNSDNRDTLSRLGVLAKSGVHVIPGEGVDADYFLPPIGRPPGAVVLMMCRLLRAKGVAEYVAAAKRVRQRIPEARFLLAGAVDPGNPESVSDAELDAWRREGAVELLGQRADVRELQQGCDVAVLASIQGEGMPRSLVEAASCARALVATVVPGSRELIEDGVDGLLVPPGDVEALADAIEALLADPARSAKMGEAARSKVLAELADAPVVAKTMAVYRV